LITSCSDVVDFLKSSEIDPVIRLVLIAIEVEPEYRFVARSLYRWGPKRVSNVPIAAKSKITNFFRLLKLIRRSDSSMIAIGVKIEYRFVARSLSGWSPNGEPNAPIATESEVTYFLRWRRSCICSFSLL
jgi:hypothetical protein